MQINELDASASAGTAPPAPACETASPAELFAGPPFIDPIELEALGLILEHSLKVHTPQHFFCWTQGLLQNLIRHELLICAMRRHESPSYLIDSYSSNLCEATQISSLFNQDTTLVPHLLKLWENNHFQPVIFDMKKDAATADSPLGRELARMEVGAVLVHGTYDITGRPASVFFFCARPGALSTRQAHLAALLVPSLHSAWVHCQFTRPAQGGAAHGAAAGPDLLTSREQEILGWIYRGKSNIEIGMILGISSLTVKNHVQKILRRLNVINRAQAVGKALALRILDSTLQRPTPTLGRPGSGPHTPA